MQPGRRNLSVFTFLSSEAQSSKSPGLDARADCLPCGQLPAGI